jgi:hypothetical protein
MRCPYQLFIHEAVHLTSEKHDSCDRTTSHRDAQESEKETFIFIWIDGGWWNRQRPPKVEKQKEI